MHDYWVEFSKIAIAHFLAVASPGPDFAIVLKQSVTHGRRAAIFTSLGIAAAILLHISYSLLGLGLLIRSSPTWFNVVKYLGAAYIAWIGVQALTAKPRRFQEESGPLTRRNDGKKAFGIGFVTNAFNPKATLFFISLFALVVSPSTPKLIQAGYGLWMVAATGAWFCLVSVLFTSLALRRKFLEHGHWIDRVLGVFFLGFAASLAFASMDHASVP